MYSWKKLNYLNSHFVNSMFPEKDFNTDRIQSKITPQIWNALSEKGLLRFKEPLNWIYELIRSKELICMTSQPYREPRSVILQD